MKGCVGTPIRVAQMYQELLAGTGGSPEEHLRHYFHEKYDEVVLLRDIPFYSICEHHMMPFIGTANVAYLPDGKVLGVSKLARIVDSYARRLQVQERLTAQVADFLMDHLRPKGVAVVVEASHTCMTIRGIRKPNSEMVTSAHAGTVQDGPAEPFGGSESHAQEPRMTGQYEMELSRHIRFSINPFLAEQPQGYNSYASKPCGEGFALYFGLWVELSGPVDSDTGFVVNVVEIDRQVRAGVVPLFVGRVCDAFRAGRHLALLDVVVLLKESWAVLKGRFGGPQVSRMCLELSPFRKIAVCAEDCAVYTFSEKFEFAATHTLWNPDFTDEKNLDVFGKCANPSGHGHNYVVEVTIERPVAGQELEIGGFEKAVHDAFIQSVDHKNLNVQVPEFAQLNPTVENIAQGGVAAAGGAVFRCGAVERDRVGKRQNLLHFSRLMRATTSSCQV